MSCKVLIAFLITFCWTALAGAAPVIGAGGILNGASFRLAAAPGGGVAPGSIISIFGTGLAVSTGLATAVPLPTSINGTSVTIGGKAAPLYFVSANQINAQVPWSTAAGPQPVVVTFNGASPAVNVTVQTASPGIFSQTSNGRGQGAIQNFVSPTNTPLNNATTAIPPGGLIIIYATGLGEVSPSNPADGAAGNGQATKNAVTVKAGTATLTPQFAGLAPGFVGLYQVNVQLPSTLVEGCNIAISLVVAGQTSNTATVSSAKSGNCTTLPSEATPAPNSAAGALALVRTTTSISIGGFPFSQTTGSFSGSFLRYGAVASASFLVPPPAGGCIVAYSDNSAGQSLPNFTGGVTATLDAGPLTYTNASGAAQVINRDASGNYVFPTGSGTGLTIGTGTHSVRGAGGKDVGAFSTSLTIAGQFSGKTDISGTNISQAAGFTASWSACPDPNGLVLVGGLTVDTPNNVQGVFFCSVACSAGSYKVGSDILNQLPLSDANGAIAALAFLTPPVRFTATGIDAGYFTFADYTFFAGLTLGK